MSPRRAGDKPEGPGRAAHAVACGGSIETAADVRRIVADAIRNVMAHPDIDPLQKARVIGQLANVELHAIELAQLDARVTAIAAVLNVRNDHQPQEK